MFADLQAHIAALPLAIQLIGLMAVLSVFDFAAACVAAARKGSFEGTRLGQWVATKGLPIITVALLYALDTSVKLVQIDLGGTQLGAFGALAYGQAITFIAGEALSIKGHLAPDSPAG